MTTRSLTIKGDELNPERCFELLKTDGNRPLNAT